MEESAVGGFYGTDEVRTCKKFVVTTSRRKHM